MLFVAVGFGELVVFVGAGAAVVLTGCGAAFDVAGALAAFVVAGALVFVVAVAVAFFVVAFAVAVVFTGTLLLVALELGVEAGEAFVTGVLEVAGLLLGEVAAVLAVVVARAEAAVSAAATFAASFPPPPTEPIPPISTRAPTPVMILCRPIQRRAVTPLPAASGPGAAADTRLPHPPRTGPAPPRSPSSPAARRGTVPRSNRHGCGLRQSRP